MLENYQVPTMNLEIVVDIENVVIRLLSLKRD